jgi:hypothetical protein
VIAVPPPVYPWPIGVGARYHPTAVNASVSAGKPVGRMRCGNAGRTFRVHLELFADRKVIIVPPGIGRGRRGCHYPLRTTTPTGVVDVCGSGHRTLGDLFRVWGRQLSRSRLLSFRRRVSVFVDGHRWRGDPGAVPLRRHGQIVIEAGAYLAPHATYLFPKGDG